MKKLTYKLSFLMMVIGITFAATSCKKDLTELNENPNEPTDVPAEYVLGHVLENSVYTVTYRIDQDFGNFWAQHWAAPNYTEEDNYVLRDATMNNSWNAFYAQSMMDCEHMINRGGNDGRLSLVAIGKIMKAWNLYQATNIWGAVPASEALQGQQNLTPNYDNQENVYNIAIGLLEAAMTDIDNHVDDGPGSFDLVFDGDMDNWKKFAKGMVLKIAFNGALAGTGNAAFQDKANDYITDGDFPFATASFSYSGAASNENPNWKHLTVRTEDAVMGQTLVDYMIGNGTSIAPADARLTVYANPAENSGEYVGMPNGVGGSVQDHSTIGFYVNNPGATYYYFTIAEAYFIQAEMIERGFSTGSAQTAYENGIQASFEQFGLVFDSAFLTGQPWEWGAEDNLVQINSQKWVALFSNGCDAWANWRRTIDGTYPDGIPALIAGVNNLNNDMIPARAFYGTDESTVNPDGLSSGNAANGGANDLNTSLWFMQN